MTLKMLRVVLGVLGLMVATAAYADNCGSPDDCRAAPGNINIATGVAAGAAGLGLGAALFGLRRKPPAPDPEPAAAEDPEPPVTTETPARDRRRPPDIVNQPLGGEPPR